MPEEPKPDTMSPNNPTLSKPQPIPDVNLRTCINCRLLEAIIRQQQQEIMDLRNELARERVL